MVLDTRVRAERTSHYTKSWLPPGPAQGAAGILPGGKVHKLYLQETKKNTSHRRVVQQRECRTFPLSLNRNIPFELATFPWSMNCRVSDLEWIGASYMEWIWRFKLQWSCSTPLLGMYLE
ncbi:hypothetical protein M758_7G138300 [Ceratodon purpureus]|uniref:Uncharacterized protein n=1 Tax=Ceratodon purpureus TaxID=3225 RepID=A0A8T0H6A6_CERPU|nr:hypothetical protein KC19_7G139900 [Ceratodon purpureus]KAG0611403.1 hypothetical protein M758_7G138300 [Ceratodon purpureus]